MTRAVIYHRVSTVDQHPEAARDELRAYCGAHGWDVVRVVEEIASGARGSLRPGWAEVMGLAKRRQIDVVVAAKVDRLARSTLDLLGQVEILASYRVRVVAAQQGIDLDPLNPNAMSRLTLELLASFATFERELIRERTVAGLRAARARGAKIGRPRAPDAPGAAQVRELRATGISWAAVAHQLGCSRSAAQRALARELPQPETGGSPEHLALDDAA